MGANQSGRSAERNGTLDEEVNFDHFQILRAIGKGSFGKVCIVQKKDCKTLYAMKYMNKAQCEQRDALKNVCREVEILTTLDHPFLVNLWFSFQDEEDLFMVSDLLLGGDLRYHIQQEVPFNEDCVKLYVIELALALDYLQSRNIVHRDIKPDNILLDEEGHAHLTDFNIAAVLEEGQLATSMSGTKPYMAPEIFACAADECVGYSYPVDWWSLGVVSYEMLSGTRPYDIHSATSISDVRGLFHERLHFPATWSAGLVELVAKLLSVRPGARLSSLIELRKMPCFHKMNFDKIAAKKNKPPFCPPKDHLNCDPTFELEEMIIETRPLHKKKKRLAKQRSLRETQGYSVDLDCETPPELSLQHLSEYYIYNRERELAKRARESKESAWEEELLEAMRASDPNPTSPSCPRSQQGGASSRPTVESTSKSPKNEDNSISQLHIAGQIRILEQKISEFCSQDPSRSFKQREGNLSYATNSSEALNASDTNLPTCLVSPDTPKCKQSEETQSSLDWTKPQGQNLSFRQETVTGSNLEFIDRTPSPDERAAAVTQSCPNYE